MPKKNDMESSYITKVVLGVLQGFILYWVSQVDHRLEDQQKVLDSKTEIVARVEANVTSQNEWLKRMENKLDRIGEAVGVMRR